MSTVTATLPVTNDPSAEALPADSAAAFTAPAAAVAVSFVAQYYSFMHSEPEKLHCFYTKQSTMLIVSGDDEGQPRFGQADIHKAIAEQGYNNCKACISSVDSQGSADGGVIVTVVGEQCNNNEQWKRFVRTFFLAVQVNGYFVLNDICRFLVEAPERPVENVKTVELTTEGVETSHEDIVDQDDADKTAAEKPAEAVTLLPEQIEEPVFVETEPVVVEETVPAVEAEKKEEPVLEAAPEEPAKEPVVEVQKPAEPAKPSGPMSYASRAAQHQGEQKSAAKQIFSQRTPSAAPQPAQRPAHQNQYQNNRQNQTNETGYVNKNVQAENPFPNCCYVRFTEQVPDEWIREQFAKYGTITELNFKRDKSCAFVTFERVESAKNAMANGIAEYNGSKITVAPRKPAAQSSYKKPYFNGTPQNSNPRRPHGKIDGQRN